MTVNRYSCKDPVLEAPGEIRLERGEGPDNNTIHAFGRIWNGPLNAMKSSKTSLTISAEKRDDEGTRQLYLLRFYDPLEQYTPVVVVKCDFRLVN
jgi:hypothetical protein